MLLDKLFTRKIQSRSAVHAPTNPPSPGSLTTSPQGAALSNIRYTSCCNFHDAVIPPHSSQPVHTVCPPYEEVAEDVGLYRSEVLQTIEGKVDELSPELRELSLKIHSMCLYAPCVVPSTHLTVRRPSRNHV